MCLLYYREVKNIMIILRQHERADISHRVKWLNNPLASKYIGDFAGKTNEGEQCDWFDRYEADDKKKFFTIECDGLPIGFAGLSNINFTDLSADIFIMIGEDDYRGKGYGGEVLSTLLDYASGELGLIYLTLDVSHYNLPAIGLYEKFGFERTDEDGDEIRMRLLLNK